MMQREAIMPSMEDLLVWVDELGELVDRTLTQGHEAHILGPHLCRLLRPAAAAAAPAPAAAAAPAAATAPQTIIPRRAAIRLALLGDCLRVAEVVIDADGEVTADEIDYIFPLLCRLAPTLGRVRREYAHHGYPAAEQVPVILAQYRDDAGPFGYRCNETRWLGMHICKRLAERNRDGEPLELYRRLQIRLTDEVCALGQVAPTQSTDNPRLREVLDLRARLASPAVVDNETQDPRIAAFCSHRAPPVFSSAAASTQIWTRDPVDVDSVHADAREAFELLVDRVTGPDHDGRGRMLLVLGESGSGKTHLMRAFRAHVHGKRLGYVGYMQLTTRSEDYAAYVLRNLVPSLEQPYDPPGDESTGLMTLSEAVVETPGALPADALRRLREAELATGPQVADLVGPLVDRLLAQPRFAGFDPDLMRMMLYLQRRDPALTSRVLKYLRCERLAPYDCDLLGGIAPRTDGDAPQRTIEELGRLIHRSGGGALVLLVDQLEDVQNLDNVAERFARAMDVLRHVADNVPSALIVLSCLDDLYPGLSRTLVRSARDRLERDPDRIQLTSGRTIDEIEALVGRRLQHLYEEMGVRFRPDNPLFPFRRADLQRKANQRMRDILDTCRQYHEACIDAGALIDGWFDDGRPPTEPPVPAPAATDLAQAWNDHLVAFAGAPPDSDPDQLRLLGQGIAAYARELGASYSLEAIMDGEDALRVRAAAAGHVPLVLIAGMCNKAPQGGWLGRQIQALARRAGPHLPVLVRRGSEFPTRSGTQIARDIGALLRQGARRVVVTDSDWRTIMAFLDFVATHEPAPHPGDSGQDTGAGDIDRWLARDRPLSQLRCFRELLDLEQLAQQPRLAPPPPPTTTTTTTPTTTTTSAAATAATSGATPGPATGATDRTVAIGCTEGLSPRPVSLELDLLTRHAAFLGSTGSGKTTLALNIVEQALARGIPTVLVDRKGDLCRYASPDWWARPLPDLEMEARKQALRERVAVHLYTPGKHDGRPLGIPVIPPRLAEASSQDQNQIARQAASALAAIMEYRKAKGERTQEVILAKAIELLGQAGADPSIDVLIDAIYRRDPELVSAVGHLAKDRYFEQLVEDLENVKHRRGELLSSGAGQPPGTSSGKGGNQGGGVLDAATLLGRDRASGKTRLSIISTKFLGDAPTVEFWVARLVVEIARWASKHPSRELQALLMFDEADIYMPALSKPATKEPMQDLLKRARSAGLGVFLATQNPGDLDYKSRENILTWFVGRVTEERTIGKMKQLLGDYRMNIAGRLGRKKSGEFFHLCQGAVTEITADRSLMVTEQMPEDEIVALARGTRQRQ